MIKWVNEASRELKTPNEENNESKKKLKTTKRERNVLKKTKRF